MHLIVYKKKDVEHQDCGALHCWGSGFIRRKSSAIKVSMLVLQITHTPTLPVVDLRYTETHIWQIKLHWKFNHQGQHAVALASMRA